MATRVWTRLLAVLFVGACLGAALAAAGAGTPGKAKQLFNGTDLSGWEHVGPGSFVIENGTLKTQGGMGLLWYGREKFGNVVLRVVFKVSKPADNSGVYIRIADRPKDPRFGVDNGYEVQIMDQANREMASTGSVYSFSKPTARASKPTGEWNVFEITLDGQRIAVRLNGVEVNDFDGTQRPTKRAVDPRRDQRPDSGYIGLQNHDQGSVVYFKEVSVQPLKK